MPIENVPDQVFAQKLVGDGVGIDPTDNVLKAPCAGKVVQLHKSHHAITIETSNGNQILLHIGIDTVNLKGEGFHPLVKVGDQVNESQNLIEFDADLIATRGMSLVSVMVLVEGTNSSTYSFSNQTKIISGETSLATISLDAPVNNQESSTDKLERAYESVPFFVRLPSGMHARPAAQLADLCKKFDSTVELIKGGKTAPLSSIISVLGLEIGKDDEIIILAIGNDCETAVKEVLQYLVKLEEEELLTFNKEQNPPADKKIIEVESDEMPWLVTAITDDGEIGRWYHASKTTALSTAAYQAISRDLPILIELSPSDACPETYEALSNRRNKNGR